MTTNGRLASALFAILLGATVAAGAQEGGAWQSTIDSQLQAFQAGDGAGAYAHASPGIRRIFPSEDIFMSMVENAYPQVRNPRSWTMGEAVPVSDGAVLQEVILTGPDGRMWRAAYQMERQPDGSWKIAGVSLQGMKTIGV